MSGESFAFFRWAQSWNEWLHLYPGVNHMLLEDWAAGVKWL